MSGSGGIYKYRCKYFLTHDCPNWVFVNYAPCADCCVSISCLSKYLMPLPSRSFGLL